MKPIILFAVLSINFVSCKKDKALPVAETTSASLQNATVIMAGNLSSYSETGSGSVKIYQQSNGENVLGLEQMNLTVSNSLVVYLSTSATVSASSIKIFSAKNLNGNVYHILPGDIDFTVFKYLIIQAELTEEIVAGSELS